MTLYCPSHVYVSHNDYSYILISQSLNLLASIASASSADIPVPAARHLVWVCGCVRGRNEVWLCCDEKGKGRLGVGSLADGRQLPTSKSHLARYGIGL